MQLKNYLELPGSLTVAELAGRIGVYPAQVRQWALEIRNPSAVNAMAIETATKGKVRRWDLSKKWHRIWPDLIGIKGAPRIGDDKKSPDEVA